MMGEGSAIVGVQGALPPHRHAQQEVNSCFLTRLLDDYASFTEFGNANDRLIAPKPDPGVGPRAGPRREFVSASRLSSDRPGTSLGVKRLQSPGHPGPK
jgi:hypothetical protein